MLCDMLGAAKYDCSKLPCIQLHHRIQCVCVAFFLPFCKEHQGQLYCGADTICSLLHSCSCHGCRPCSLTRLNHCDPALPCLLHSQHQHSLVSGIRVVQLLVLCQLRDCAPRQCWTNVMMADVQVLMSLSSMAKLKQPGLTCLLDKACAG